MKLLQLLAIVVLAILVLYGGLLIPMEDIEVGPLTAQDLTLTSGGE